MNTAMTIALRNLREHKAKSLIIGSLIAVSIFLFIIGNSVMDTANKGLEKAFIKHYTGEIVIFPDAGPGLTIIGNAGDLSGGKTPTIQNYPEVYQMLKEYPGIQAINAQVFSMAMIPLSGGEEENEVSMKDGLALVYLFGVEPEMYQDMFPDNLTIHSGSFLQLGQEGIVLPKYTIDEIEKESGRTYQVGDVIRLNFMSTGVSAGFSNRIREVPLTGIFSFKTDNTNLNGFAFIDAQSLRSLAGMVVGTPDEIRLEEEDTALLDQGLEFDENAFFMDESVIPEIEADDEVQSEEELNSVLGDMSMKELYTRPDAGAWHYVMLRLEPGIEISKKIAEMNRYFLLEDIPLKAVEWKAASASLSQMTTGFQWIFNVIVVIIAIVSVIIIMNTLIISVIERTAEIGTMRALGAQKSYVRQVFVSETMAIALIFGTLGVILSLLIVLVMNITGVHTENFILESVFGGKNIHPLISVKSIIFAYCIILLIGFLSSLYPVSVAMKVEPVKAIQTE